MGSYTANFNLYKPAIDETCWGDKVNQNFDIIDEELTANKILEKLKNVGGSGSGLDADLLDGKHASDFVPVSSDSDISISISGTQVFNISTAGILTFPKQSCCVAYLSADQSISANTWTKVALNTVEIDTQNEFDSTNNRVTVSESGKYLVVAEVRHVPETENNLVATSIFVNGAEKATEILRLPSTIGQNISVTKIFNLQAGDYVEMFVKNFSADETVVSAFRATFLCVAKIA